MLLLLLLLLLLVMEIIPAMLSMDLSAALLNGCQHVSALSHRNQAT